MQLKPFMQKGFSLTEILIALGLLGGISLVTMKLMDDQSTNQTYLKAKTEIEKTTSLVSAYLGDKNRCHAFVKGRRFDEAIEKISAKDSTQERVILKAGVGVDYGEFFMDEGSIRLVDLGATSAIKNQAKLVMRFRLKNTSFLKASSANDPRLIVTKEIPIPIIRSSADVNVIESCGQKVGDAETNAREVFCSSLGEAFTWNKTTSECVAIEKNCPKGQVMTRVTSLGGYICDDATNQIVLEEIFELNSDHNCPNGFRLEHNAATKKIGIKCNP